MSLTPGSAWSADRLLGERYLLGDLVGRGAMAEVYRAHDRLLERSVAVKIFRAHSDPVARRRFDEEAYVLARLAHPGLALIFDVGMLDDRPFLVMEFIDGQDLRTRLLSGPLPPRDVMRIGGVLADALAHAHHRGVVHRDVKPANIMLDRDELPHLTDFGIAVLSGAPRLTSSNTLVGTPAYLAPEQLHGDEAGPPADVYALSLVLLECLTGEVEYPAGDNLASALARLSRPPRIPPGLPLVFADLLAAMTSTEPTARPSAEQCARQLLASADEPSPVEPAAIAPEPVAWWADEDRTVMAPAVSSRPVIGSARRGRRSLTAAGVGVAGVIAALVVLLNIQPSLPGRPPSGSPAEHATSQPVTSGDGDRGGSGRGAGGSRPSAGTLVVNEGPALTVVTTPSRPTPAVPPPTATISTPATTSASPSSTTDGSTTTTSSLPTTTSGAPGNGTGIPNP